MCLCSVCLFKSLETWYKMCSEFSPKSLKSVVHVAQIIYVDVLSI